MTLSMDEEDPEEIPGSSPTPHERTSLDRVFATDVQHVITLLKALLQERLL